MLDRIEIVDFQRHERLRIRFDPRITCVVGDSDRGKSSVLRALRWACMNHPRGDSLIRWGADRARVRLWVDGHRIERRRGKGGNAYRLDDGDEYKAIGSEVPQEIADLLRMGEINWQLQHDAPFWFSLSPGQVSRELNSIVNLDAMDNALANAAAATRKAKSTADLTKERLAKAKDERKALAWTKRADAALAAVEAQEAELAASRRKTNALAALLAKASDAENKAKQAPPDTKRIDDTHAAWVAAKQEREALETIIRKVREAEEEQCRSEKKAKQAEEAFSSSIGKVCPICQRPT